MPHILIVDDDSRLRELLKKFLTREGFKVTGAESAERARHLLESLNFDILLLDVMMGGESGLSLAGHIRKSSEVPILMLTAKTQIEDRLAGFEAGVDDYLSKPFDPSELLLRIAAILRRTGLQSADAPPFIVFGPYHFDIPTAKLMRGDQRIELTRNEQDIMRELALNFGEAITRYQITQAMGGSEDANDRAIDVQITRLRKKIETDPKAPEYIQTVRGVGYRLCPS